MKKIVISLIVASTFAGMLVGSVSAEAKDDPQELLGVPIVTIQHTSDRNAYIGHNAATAVVKQTDTMQQKTLAKKHIVDRDKKVAIEEKRLAKIEAAKQAKIAKEVEQERLAQEKQDKIKAQEVKEASEYKTSQKAKVAKTAIKSSPKTSGKTMTQETTKSETGLRTLTMDSTAYDVNVASGGHPAFPNGGVAADLGQFPKGTRLKIEYQNGNVEVRTVNDTGTFVASSPNQLDISMPNDQALAYGRQTVTVTVLGQRE